LWRLPGNDVLERTGVSYTSFLTDSSEALSIDLEKWLLDTQHEVPSWLSNMDARYPQRASPLQGPLPAYAMQDPQIVVVVWLFIGTQKQISGPPLYPIF
jgi:hypothetical protein